jgi:transketolase
VYLRFGRDSYRVVREIHSAFQIGRAKRLRNGSDLTIVTTGIMVSEGLKAAEILSSQGLSVRLIHMPTVKPLDEEILLEAAHETQAVVTAEEHSIIGGLGEAVAGFVSEHAPIPVRRVGVRDVFGESGQAAELLDKYGLRASNVVDAAFAVLSGAAR